MVRVLKLIQLWHMALVPKSRHRDDLLHISDMYKLLQNKGKPSPSSTPHCTRTRALTSTSAWLDAAPVPGYKFPAFNESEGNLIFANAVRHAETLAPRARARRRRCTLTPALPGAVGWATLWPQALLTEDELEQDDQSVQAAVSTPSL